MNMPPKSGVYAIVNSVNNERYIGSSTNIGMRWNCHKSDLRKGRHSSLKLQADWNEYSEKVFRLEVLKLVLEKDQRLRLEKDLIKESNPSYNSRCLPTERCRTQVFPMKNLDRESLMAEKLYTTQEIAEMLHVHHGTVRHWIATEKLGSYQFGGIYRIAQSDLDDFVQRTRTKRAEEKWARCRQVL